MSLKWLGKVITAFKKASLVLKNHFSYKWGAERGKTNIEL